MDAPAPGPSSSAPGQLTPSEDLASIVEAFQPGIVHAVGYGSGVFVQQPFAAAAASSREQTATPPGSDEPMIDLLVTTSDSAAFHGHMLERFPAHYSALARAGGPNFCVTLQRSEALGAGVYFNPMVDFPAPSSPSRGRKIKYGVVHLDDLLDDLETWRWMYAAGRMHKPTAAVVGLAGGDRVAAAQRRNLDMALSASLLLLGAGANKAGEGMTKGTYSLMALYEIIAGLSYAGDPRMDVGGEDPGKVGKLVRSSGQEGRFSSLYRDSISSLQKMGLLETLPDQGLVAIDLREGATRRHLWKTLPKRVNKGTCYGVEIEQPDTMARHLAGCLFRIVRSAAVRQSLKGVLTAGVSRSIQYVGAKIAKGCWKV